MDHAVSQSVKEVLQSLVDDNLVNTDKCGVQTVFWSLPSEASQKVCFAIDSSMHVQKKALQAGVVANCFRSLVIWFMSWQRKHKLAKLKEDLEAKNVAEQRLREELQQEKVGRETTDERTNLIQEISKKEERLRKIDEELARFAEFDPEEMKKLQYNIKKVRESANRWVDNIFNCESWASKKFSMERKDFGRQFGIPADLDYIEG